MPLQLTLDYELGVPVYRQIFDAIASALAAGTLASDEQLPTIHGLARQLDVNPNTIIRAYRELEQAGYVVSERGRGTFPLGSKPETPRADLLRQIWRRTLQDCERKGVSQSELKVFLKKEFT